MPRSGTGRGEGRLASGEPKTQEQAGVAMRTAGTFTPEIEPATEAMPPRVAIILPGSFPDERGNVRLTPDCMTLDELESAINGLQDELDVLRADARRVFDLTAGHA